MPVLSYFKYLWSLVRLDLGYSILALVGIQILGLGPLFTPNLGMILQAAYEGAAIFRSMWWWWVPPTVTLMIIFVSLFLISVALDELANPHLRERAK